MILEKVYIHVFSFFNEYNCSAFPPLILIKCLIADFLQAFCFWIYIKKDFGKRERAFKSKISKSKIKERVLSSGRRGEFYSFCKVSFWKIYLFHSQTYNMCMYILRFSGQLVCPSFSPCTSLDGSSLSPCGPKREAVTWCDTPSTKCLRYSYFNLWILLQNTKLV